MLRLSPDGHELAELVAALPSGRTLLGLAGSPGAGKTTLSGVLAAAYAVPVVPMDGYHLADVELARRGLLERKGAPETFDAEGYAALLARLRARPDHVVVAPMFERDLEQPLAGAIPVLPEADLVVTEGNYLLLDEPRWHGVRRQLDAVWHVRVDPALRMQRLVARHIAFGKDPEAARRWVERVDVPNAELVDAVADRADVVVDATDLDPQRVRPTSGAS